MRLFWQNRSINLALQGGGAHGAFTWGVLDRLLDEPHLDFSWVSGTSAGAVNAVALASGLAEGGREEARARLAAVWHAVRDAGLPEFLQMNPLIAGMRKFAGAFSPYELNPLGIDPLRGLLEDNIDFKAIRSDSSLKLMIATTDVATGARRLFRTGEIDVDVVLASACLPSLQAAVQIDGRFYWDGGFSANPDLINLAAESRTRDTLIIQINPSEASDVPTQAKEIADHVNRITFNQPLRSDIAMVLAAREMSSGWFAGRAAGRYQRLARHRFHMIEAGQYTSQLPAESKGQPGKALFDYLLDAGRTEADVWLERNLGNVGRRESADLSKWYEGTQAVMPKKPAASKRAAAAL